MTIRTLPPDLLPAAGRDLIGGQCSVQFRVPLGCQLRLQRRQIVVAFQDPATCTIGTAAAGGRAAGYHRWPVMALFTPPPDPPVAEGRNLVWGQGAVQLPVPLVRHLREQSRQIVFPRQDYLPGTDRTARAMAATG